MTARSRKPRRLRRLVPMGAVALAGLVASGCSPSVRLQAPDEPIRFDVNVNITEQKRLQIDEEVLQLIRANPSLFGFTQDEIEGMSDGNISGENEVN